MCPCRFLRIKYYGQLPLRRSLEHMQYLVYSGRFVRRSLKHMQYLVYSGRFVRRSLEHMQYLVYSGRFFYACTVVVFSILNKDLYVLHITGFGNAAKTVFLWDWCRYFIYECNNSICGIWPPEHRHRRRRILYSSIYVLGICDLT